MNRPYLIPGEAPVSSPYVSGSDRSRRSPLMTAVIVVWLLAGLGFFVWKIGFAKTADIPASVTAPSIRAGGTQDLAHHMEAVSAKIMEAETRLRRAEDLVSRTLPAVTRNFLFVEKQHLQTALAANEGARRNIEEARQEVDLILNSIKETKTK